MIYNGVYINLVRSKYEKNSTTTYQISSRRAVRRPTPFKNLLVVLGTGVGRFS